MSGVEPAPFREVDLGRDRHAFEEGADGALVVRALEPLGAYPVRATERLEQHARAAPERTLIAKRGPDRDWAHLTYAEALARAERVGAALLARGLSAERPLAILSGNGFDHAVLALGAMHAGVPYVPVSPAYSATPGYQRLKDILALVTPGLVYAADGRSFGPALAAAAPGIPVVTGDGALSGGRATALADFEAEGETAAAREALQATGAAVGPDTVAKVLFTSGSTGLPKGVITTHRMLCANQAQIAAAMPFLAAAPPVLVDWLPWHHVFGGNHNFGIVLHNGGSLYIDDGKPLPTLIGETVRNLTEIAPTAYFTVPKGYEALVPHLAADAAFRESFFSRLAVCFFAAAGLPQPVWDAFDAVATAHLGRRVPMLTGLGSTETAPFAMVCRPEHCRSGRVGLPVRGLELKLAPVADKREARVRGPNVTPGYWRDPAATASARDEDGFFRMGDALVPADPDDLSVGYAFDGRLNEDFKLTSGVWVSVGSVRARFLDRAAPYARDVALAGENRDAIAGLVVPDLEACRGLCPDLPRAAPAEAVLADAAVRAHFAGVLRRLAAEATGSSNRLTRLLLLAEPPSIDRNEATDKGSINQRAVLRHRAAAVEALYAEPLGADVILPEVVPPELMPPEIMPPELIPPEVTLP